MTFDYSAGLAAVHAAVFGDDPRTGQPYPRSASATASSPAPVLATATAMSDAERLAALDAMTLPGTEAEIARAKADGRLPTQAAGAVLAAYKAHMVRSGRPEYAQAYTPPSIARSTATGPDAWAEEFGASAALQAEFRDVKTYVAYRQNAPRHRALAPGLAPLDTRATAGTFNPVRDPAAWRAEYAASAELQREFPTVESYVGFKTGVATGRVRILGR